MRSFFSNAVYATWFQSVILVVTVYMAMLTIRANHHENAVNNANQVVQRYYVGSPTLFSYTNDLSHAQYSVVQDAKAKILNYNPDHDKNLIKLFEVARPMVLKKFNEDEDLRHKYEAVEPYFVSTVVCVDAGACDEGTIVNLLAEDLRRFYNAVCSYQSGDQDSAGDSYRLVFFLVKRAHFADLYQHYFLSGRGSIVSAPLKFPTRARLTPRGWVRRVRCSRAVPRGGPSRAGFRTAARRGRDGGGGRAGCRFRSGGRSAPMSRRC